MLDSGDEDQEWTEADTQRITVTNINSANVDITATCDSLHMKSGANFFQFTNNVMASSLIGYFNRFPLGKLDN